MNEILNVIFIVVFSGIFFYVIIWKLQKLAEKKKDQERFLSHLIAVLENNDTSTVEKLIEDIKVRADRYGVYDDEGGGGWIGGELAPPLEDLLRSKVLTNEEKIAILKQIKYKGLNFLGLPPFWDWSRKWSEIHKIYHSIIDSKMKDEQDRFLSQLMSALEKDDIATVEKLIKEMKVRAIYYRDCNRKNNKLNQALQDLLRTKALTNKQKITCLKQIADHREDFLNYNPDYQDILWYKKRGEIYKIYQAALDASNGLFREREQ